MQFLISVCDTAFCNDKNGQAFENVNFDGAPEYEPRIAHAEYSPPGQGNGENEESSALDVAFAAILLSFTFL